jgi:hypothetical protein
MARAQWRLHRGRPVIEVTLTLVPSGKQVARRLLADTGAGGTIAGFELLLDEQDCLLCGGIPAQGVVLGGAYVASFPVYLVRARLPHLGFDQTVPAVGVLTTPKALDGIATFAFLNRFTYGNFANRAEFGLEI